MGKIPASNTKLTIIHILRGGLFIPIVANLLTIALMSLTSVDNINSYLYIFILIPIVGFSVGALYSSHFLFKKYEIPNPQIIARNSVFLLAVLYLFGIVLNFLNASKSENGNTNIFELIVILISLSFFYIITRKILG